MRALFPDEARELGVRADSDWELLVEELVEVLSTFVLVRPSTFFVLVNPVRLANSGVHDIDRKHVGGGAGRATQYLLY